MWRSWRAGRQGGPHLLRGSAAERGPVGRSAQVPALLGAAPQACAEVSEMTAGLLGGPGRLRGTSGPLSASSPASDRQVEYLYSLVYQALDFISGKR